ncbi:MAG: hypothetical protein EOO73_09105 [Myxococcales bacterium]|nr:MAG: hypothetical protein EOO73_09105 [Myxococcales bacterium]
MKRIISALSVLACVTTFGLAGCGGDDDGDGDGAAGKSGNEPTAGAPATGSPNLACDPAEATTCQNDTDCDFVIDGTARSAAQDCGKMDCLTSEDPDCARECILEKLDMTSDCAACYADFVGCTIQNCVAACIGDPDSDECHECQETEGCRPTFDACSGLPE